MSSEAGNDSSDLRNASFQSRNDPFEPRNAASERRNASFRSRSEAFQSQSDASVASSATLSRSGVASPARIALFRTAIVLTASPLTMIRPRITTDPRGSVALETADAAVPAAGVPLPAPDASPEASDDVLQTRARPPPPCSGPPGKHITVCNKRGVMQFPEREAEILRLAREVAAGLAAHPEIFPAPPHAPDEILQDLATAGERIDQSIVKAFETKESTASKNEAVAVVADKTKAALRYAEVTVRHDPSKLELLGWGAPRRGTANDVPGQVRALEVIREGADWVHLDWKEPAEGGRVGAFKIQRRKRDGGAWIDVGMAMESEALLNGQEAGVEFEYHVIALNKAGEGRPSNIVRVVL